MSQEVIDNNVQANNVTNLNDSDVFQYHFRFKLNAEREHRLVQILLKRSNQPTIRGFVAALVFGGLAFLLGVAFAEVKAGMLFNGVGIALVLLTIFSYFQMLKSNRMAEHAVDKSIAQYTDNAFYEVVITDTFFQIKDELYDLKWNWTTDSFVEEFNTSLLFIPYKSQGQVALILTKEDLGDEDYEDLLADLKKKFIKA